MGCGGSKSEQAGPGGADAVHPVAARAAPSTSRGTKSRSGPAGHTSAGRATSRQGGPSRAGPRTSSGQTTSKQGASRQGKSRKGASRQGASRQGASRHSASRQGGGEAKPRRGVTGDGEGGQPPEDSVLQHEIETLSAYIEQHAENYYSQDVQATARRDIGWYIVQEIIMQAKDDQQVSEQISNLVRQYAEPDQGADRDDHLFELCQLGGRIGRMIQSHPAHWSFGPWDQGVMFPSVLRDGVEISPAS